VDLWRPGSRRGQAGEIGASSPRSWCAMWWCGRRPCRPALRRDRKSNVPGYIRGYDVRTGKRLVDFSYHRTTRRVRARDWENGSWSTPAIRRLGSVERGRKSSATCMSRWKRPLAISTRHRLGNDLFGESLVCLARAHGRRVWHFQLVHSWRVGLGLPTAPTLLDITVAGRRSRLLRRSPAGLGVCLRPGYRQARVAHGRAGRATVGRAGRAHFPHAAVSLQSPRPSIARVLRSTT